MLVNCLDPVLIFNPRIFELSLKCDKYYLDGECRTIDSSMRYDILHDCKPSSVLKLPYAKNLSREWLETLGVVEKKKCLERFDNFLCNSFLCNSETGETYPLYQFVPCGKCDCCKSSLLNSYVQRCQFQLEQDKVPAYFVTLTYNTGHNPIHHDKRHVQLFKKRLSKLVGKPLKFFVTSEYGSDVHSKRPHYHMLIFGMPIFHEDKTNQDIECLRYFQFCWREPQRNPNGFGFLSFKDYNKLFPKVTFRPADYDPYSFGYVNSSVVGSVSAALGYVMKYVMKDQVSDALDDGDFKTFKSVSCNMGLKFAQWLCDNVPSRDGEFSYLSYFQTDLMPTSVYLSKFYLRKLFPSMSQLISPEVRRAAVSLYEDSRFFFSNRDYVPRDLFKAVLSSYVHLTDTYPFLFDFASLDYKPVKLPIYRTYENEGRFEKFNSDISFYYRDFLDKMDVILKFELDYSGILSSLKKRCDLLNQYKARSYEDLYAAAFKWRKSMKEVVSKSTL